jgi:hypothetical protein
VFPDYFTEIEHHFSTRRGTPFLFSPKDVALIREWADEGIPLPIVIEAIDSVFEKATERQKMVNSLRYCRHAVKEIWKERKELTIGSGASPEEAVEPLLEELAGMVEPVSSAFAVAIRALAAERSVPRIEERLMELEHELIDSLLSHEDAEQLRAEAAMPGLDEKVRARTEEANLRRLVRERFDLPRLTLFR